MEKLQLTIPTLYGDHHTLAVRAVLEKMEGISSLFVSPGRHQIALQFDPKKVKREAIEQALAAQGYEAGVAGPVYAPGLNERSTRHSATYSGVGPQLSFAETTLVRDARPLWPCPGFDPRSRPVAD
ncbi:MAG: hypothetical protein A2Y93_07955 [Chloroflexi bacterium RBG_13_68_17]|jgi:copper chaperone CopZ|nr:MAG: hypothetical protein A2Y93_07955 [Chloroflexi bacterium RBG_13_68_17]